MMLVGPSPINDAGLILSVCLIGCGLKNKTVWLLGIKKIPFSSSQVQSVSCSLQFCWSACHMPVVGGLFVMAVLSIRRSSSASLWQFVRSKSLPNCCGMMVC